MMAPIPNLKVCIQIGSDEDGNLFSVCNFADPSAHSVLAVAGNPDLGLDEAHTVLHDAVHMIVCLLSGVGVSPVLERVAGVRPGASVDPINGLDQESVDLEEAAAFALHALIRHYQEKANADRPL